VYPSKSFAEQIRSDEVLKRIQAHYVESIARGEDDYVHKDEESLTEALGEAYASLDETVEGVDGRSAYHLVADYQKLHKRRKAAGDVDRCRGIFQIELADDARPVRYRFGLLFHAKVQWRGRDAGLLEQSRRLNGNFRRGMVIDYSRDGYTAASAAHVIAADGDRKRMRNRVQRLSQMLAIEFVHGRMGIMNLYWCADKATLHDPAEQGDSFSIEHVFSMRVRRSSSSTSW
jgi:hypothetical protein